MSQSEIGGWIKLPRLEAECSVRLKPILHGLIDVGSLPNKDLPLPAINHNDPVWGQLNERLEIIVEIIEESKKAGEPLDRDGLFAIASMLFSSIRDDDTSPVVVSTGDAFLQGFHPEPAVNLPHFYPRNSFAHVVDFLVCIDDDFELQISSHFILGSEQILTILSLLVDEDREVICSSVDPIFVDDSSDYIGVETRHQLKNHEFSIKFNAYGDMFTEKTKHLLLEMLFDTISNQQDAGRQFNNIARPDAFWRIMLWSDWKDLPKNKGRNKLQLDFLNEVYGDLIRLDKFTGKDFKRIDPRGYNSFHVFCSTQGIKASDYLPSSHFELADVIAKYGRIPTWKEGARELLRTDVERSEEELTELRAKARAWNADKARRWEARKKNPSDSLDLK